MAKDLFRANVLELSNWQKEELNRRIAALPNDPDSGSPWDDVKARTGSKA